MGGGARVNGRNFFEGGGGTAPSGVQRGGKIGGGKTGRARMAEMSAKFRAGVGVAEVKV